MGMMFRGFGNPPQQGPLVDMPRAVTQQINLPAPTADPQNGFFQKNGLGLNLIGAIADGVSQGFGGSPNFAIARQQQQARQQRLQDIEAERAAQRDDWQMQQQWKLEHPETRAPHYWETNDGSLAVVDPATGQPKVLYQDPTPKVTWTQVDLPNGQKQLIPSINGQMVGGAGGPPASTPPTKPIGKLTPIQGGATPSGSRPF